MSEETRLCPSCGAASLEAFCGRCGAAMTSEPPAPVGSVYALAALLAAGAVAIGSFLPWASAGAGILKASRSGIEGGDGWLTLGIAAAAALVAIRGLMQSRLPHPGLVVTAGIALVALAAWELVDIVNRQGTSVFGIEIKASPDLGLLAVAAGGIGLVVVALAGQKASIGAGRDS